MMMKNRFKHSSFRIFYWVLLLVVIRGFSLVAQDSTAIQVRKPNKSEIVAFQKSIDYQYETVQNNHIETWWERQLRAFAKWFSEAFSGVGNPTFWKIFAYCFVAAVIVFVTLKLMGVDIESFFSKQASTNIPYETLVENIHQINFTEAITDAIQQKDYRLAVRLHYLKTLKELSDNGLIDWQINKTNQSYVYEIQDSQLKKTFERVTRQFEYIWYGDFPIDEQAFLQVREEFLIFSNQII